MNVDRVNDRLVDADGERTPRLREPRIAGIPVPGDDKFTICCSRCDNGPDDKEARKFWQASNNFGKRI